jgi:hypothetical protein
MTRPQFAEISFFNISTVIFPTCGQGCGEDLRARTPGMPQALQAGNTTRTASGCSSRNTASRTSPKRDDVTRPLCAAAPRTGWLCRARRTPRGRAWGRSGPRPES